LPNNDNYDNNTTSPVIVKNKRQWIKPKKQMHRLGSILSCFRKLIRDSNRDLLTNQAKTFRENRKASHPTKKSLSDNENKEKEKEKTQKRKSKKNKQKEDVKTNDSIVSLEKTLKNKKGNSKIKNHEETSSKDRTMFDLTKCPELQILFDELEQPQDTPMPLIANKKEILCLGEIEYEKPKYHTKK